MVKKRQAKNALPLEVKKRTNPEGFGSMNVERIVLEPKGCGILSQDCKRSVERAVCLSF